MPPLCPTSWSQALSSSQVASHADAQDVARTALATAEKDAAASVTAAEKRAATAVEEGQRASVLSVAAAEKMGHKFFGAMHKCYRKEKLVTASALY